MANNNMANNNIEEFDTNIIERVDNHFGFSGEEDEYVASSDHVTLKKGEQIPETYTYETHDKSGALRSIIANFFRISERLKIEEKPEIRKRCREIIKTNRECLLRNKEYIEKKMKLNLNSILGQYTK